MTIRRRRILIGVLAALGLLLVLLAWKLPPAARLSVEVSAKWACQCRYIDGGGDAFCATEDPLGFSGTGFRFEPEKRQATASIWGLVEATGRYEPGSGCMVR